MSRQIARRARCVVLLLATWPMCGQGRLEGPSNARRFVSTKYGFTMPFPSGWRVFLNRDTPLYLSFGPDEAGQFSHQLKLPLGGAAISVVAQADSPAYRAESLAEWATRDATILSRGQFQVRPLQLPASTGVVEAVTSSYDTATSSEGEQSEHRVNVFFEFRGHKFAAYLLYVAGDPSGSSFEELFQRVVQGFRPIKELKGR
jgi:hypothetical protein